MSATVYPLQPTSAYRQNDTPICDDSDDDISLANIMTRKLQVNQQVMINNWTTSNYQYCYGDTIPVVGYQPFYNNQLINPQLIPYNNNNNNSNNIYQQQHYSRNSGRPRSSNLGANHRSSLQNTRSTPLNTHQGTKIRVSPPSTAPSTTKKSKNYRQYSSSSSSSTSTSVSSSLPNHPHRKHIHRDEINDCESQSSSTPSFTPPSLIDDNSTRRSSIYSLTSATTSYSTTPSSDTITNHDHSSSPPSTTKKVTVKRSFSKKLKHVFTSSNNNKHQDSSQLQQQQQQQQQHNQPALRKTPSISSLSSVNTISSENNSSIRHSFVSLFRRPSKLSTHIEQEDNQQPSIETDSSSQLPKKNIKANNHKGYHHHHHHHINDTPSVTSSTSETTTISNSSHNNQNHKQSLSKDGFDISHQNTTLPQITTSYLQHNSPMLRPSTNHHHHRNEGSVIYNDFNDDAISSIYAGSVHSYAKSTTSSTYKKQRQQLRKQSFSSINHSSNNTTKVRFTKTVQVHETFSAKEYDRQCDDQTTCQTLTPIIALQIKQELNEYKLNEMEVHPHSRQYTHFFL